MKWFIKYVWMFNERRPALNVLLKLELSVTITNQPSPCIVILVYFTIEWDGVDYEIKIEIFTLENEEFASLIFYFYTKHYQNALVFHLRFIAMEYVI